MALLAATALTLAFYVWRRGALARSRWEALAFTSLYCLSLGLALRFGARTYPGIYFPDSAFLNALLNGNSLFVDVGYAAVLLAWAAGALLILGGARLRRFKTAITAIKWLALGLALSIAIYGFACAAILRRVA